MVTKVARRDEGQNVLMLSANFRIGLQMFGMVMFDRTNSAEWRNKTRVQARLIDRSDYRLVGAFFVTQPNSWQRYVNKAVSGIIPLC